MVRGAVAAAMLLVATVACQSDDSPADDAAPARGRPNIVVVMTDDQNLTSLSVMVNLAEAVTASGTTFTQAIASYPLCCPSRATYLTGQYASNHGVLGNVAPYGGFGVFRDQETTFPVALEDAGYETIHIGKYLNGYGGAAGPATIPPGWSQWQGSVDPSTYQYTGFTLLEGRELRTYGDDVYQSDLYTDRAVEAIRAQAGSEAPFFLDVAYLAPHVNAEEGPDAGPNIAIPAPRHAGAFADEPLPQPPSFDEADVSDKPAWVQALPPISPEVRAQMEEAHRAYLESLLAVDEGVERIVTALEETGQLDETYVIFTSDNGFFRGEHRQPAGKGRFYEPAIRVPLVIRGPGIPEGRSEDAVVANIDLAPTILDLADVEPLRGMDGRSLLAVLGQETPDDRGILLEGGGPFAPDVGIRTSRYAYSRQGTGELELYDLVSDPDQLRNLAGTPEVADVELDLARRLAVLTTCATDTCE